MLLGHFTKLQKYKLQCAYQNVHLVKQQVKQVSFSRSSERQQRV